MSYYRHGPPPGPGYGVRIGVPPLTPMIRYIMIISGVIWAVQFLEVLVLKQAYLSHYFGLVPADVIRGFLWQPFTYMWLHSPQFISHILFNMLILWMIGGDLERHWGSRAFLRYYLICGVGAGLFILFGGLLAGETLSTTVGASGAIYGVLLAFGMIFSERRVLLMLIFPVRARTLAIILFAVAFLSTLSASGGGVSHVAHLGGMVVGYLYLKRAWRLGEFYRELAWKVRRRKFRVIPPKDDDPWVN